MAVKAVPVRLGEELSAPPCVNIAEERIDEAVTTNEVCSRFCSQCEPHYLSTVTVILQPLCNPKDNIILLKQMLYKKHLATCR